MESYEAEEKKGRKKMVVAVSGGFDPIHVGHVRMFKEARALGDKLVVILNNDNWLKKKKDFAFMNERERAEIIRNIKWVDEVVITKRPINPKDMSVVGELKRLKPTIFANGNHVGWIPDPKLAVLPVTTEKTPSPQPKRRQTFLI